MSDSSVHAGKPFICNKVLQKQTQTTDLARKNAVLSSLYQEKLRNQAGGVGD